MSAPIDYVKVASVLRNVNATFRMHLLTQSYIETAAKLCEAWPAIEALLELCNGPEHNDDTGYVDFHTWLDTLRHEAKGVREVVKS